MTIYWGVDKSLARPTCRCVLFDSENISFDASLVIQGVSKRALQGRSTRPGSYSHGFFLMGIR